MKKQSVLIAALAVSAVLSSCGPTQAPGASSASGSQPPAVSGSQPAGSVKGGDKSVQPPDVSRPDVSAAAPAGSQPVEPVKPVDPSAPADWSWFDDAVIIGDSVSLKLKNFVVKERKTDPDYFGKAQFLTSGSLGSGNSLWEVSDKSVHPSFQGTKMRLEESVPKTGAKKIYIMLGTNDVAVYGTEGSVKNMETLIDLIAANVPDAQFFIQSATPICEGAEKKSLNNAALVEYNKALSEMCQRRGFQFVDVASAMRDERGFLPREYCSDPDGMGIHLTDAGCRIWLDYLSTHH